MCGNTGSNTTGGCKGLGGYEPFQRAGVWFPAHTASVTLAPGELMSFSGLQGYRTQLMHERTCRQIDPPHKIKFKQLENTETGFTAKVYIPAPSRLLLKQFAGYFRLIDPKVCKIRTSSCLSVMAKVVTSVFVCVLILALFLSPLPPPSLSPPPYPQSHVFQTSLELAMSWGWLYPSDPPTFMRECCDRGCAPSRLVYVMLGPEPRTLLCLC